MDQWHWGFTSFAGPNGPAPIYYSLFTRNQGTSLEPCPICAPLPGASPATIHFSLFTLTFFAHKAITCGLVQNSAPSSSSPRRRRGAPRGGGEEEALVQTKMDPCFYKMVLCYMVSMAEVWCRLECPLLLFPLPLAWCARKTSETCTLVLRPAGVGSKAGAGAPGLGRFKGMRFLREGGNRNPPSLKRLFGDFLAAQKVPRGPGPGRPRGWQVCRKPAPGPAGPDKRAPRRHPPASLFLLTPPYRRLIINIEKGRCDKRLALSVN